MKTKISVLAVILSLALGAAYAHGGAKHVMGTVAKMSANTIDVKNLKGETTQVMFDEKTTFSKAGAKVKASDLKAGDRVVIEASEMKEMGGMLNAMSVRIGSGKSMGANMDKDMKMKPHAH